MIVCLFVFGGFLFAQSGPRDGLIIAIQFAAPYRRRLMRQSIEGGGRLGGVGGGGEGGGMGAQAIAKHRTISPYLIT